MYNISVRINHGTFHGIPLITNHNLVSSKFQRIGKRILLPEWDVIAEVYQCAGRTRPIEPTDTWLDIPTGEGF